jgi:cytochrome b
MKTYIWSLPTRLFHWLIVIGLITAYILGEEEGLLNLHTSFGYFVGILILFRLAWGIIGPKYSRFSDFKIGFNNLKKFATQMNQSKSEHPGHNPAAALIMLGIILTTTLLVISGILLLSSKGEGFFAFLKPGMSNDFLEETHEIMVSILFTLVIIHLIGNIVDFKFNRKMGTLKSIFTGYKNTDKEGIRTNTFQVVIASLFILSAMAVIPYTLSNQKISANSENSEGIESNGQESEESEGDDD